MKQWLDVANIILVSFAWFSISPNRLYALADRTATIGYWNHTVVRLA